MPITLGDLGRLAEEAKLYPIYNNPLFPPSAYYRFLKLLAAEHKPLLSVVLGVCGGGDCLHLALGFPHGYVVGVDKAYDHPEQIEHIRAVTQNFQFWEGDSVASAGKIRELHGLVDILFIDTSHEYDQTMSEVNAWFPFMAPEGIIVMDDLFRPGMEKAWSEMPDPKIRLDFLHDGTPDVGGGFGCVLLP